jgi:iron complex transport system substrate-binding protein
MTHAMSPSHTPRRIACLQPSATVILHAIGELERVVACTRYCTDVVPEVADGKRAILPDSWTADAKQIAEVRADLVIASVPYQEKAVIEILKSGSRFLGFAPKTLADIYTDISIIAGTVAATDRGKEVIAKMQSHFEQVRSRTVTASRPRVFCEEWGKPIITSQRWVAELVEIAGGDFAGSPGSTISREQVLQYDPDVIIAAWCGAGNRVPLEKIVADRGWQRASAVRTGRVFCIRDEYLNTPAPTVVYGLDALAYAIHPELFARTKGIRQITDVPASQVSYSKP